MRTTLTLDEDVLAAAKELARTRRQTLGEVVSALARQSLQPVTVRVRHRNGVPLLPIQPGARVVTGELVRRLDEELP